MPRFMPVPKFAVAPVSEPSAPMLIGAPPAPCDANSAQETVPPPDAAAAGAVVGLAAAAAGGAVVGWAAGAVEEAARIRASTLRPKTRTIAVGPPGRNFA